MNRQLRLKLQFADFRATDHLVIDLQCLEFQAIRRVLAIRACYCAGWDWWSQQGVVQWGRLGCQADFALKEAGSPGRRSRLGLGSDFTVSPSRRSYSNTSAAITIIIEQLSSLK